MSLGSLQKKVAATLAMVLAILGMAVSAAILPSYVSATDISREACSLNSNSSVCQEMKDGGRLPSIATNIINAALMIVGILAVAMIIFAGIRYVTSAGNKGRVEQAKQILIYSITGLVVAISAYAIVNFVLSKF